MLILPTLVFILALIIAVIQVGLVKERLEYTAYLACREAVTCGAKNISDAEEFAFTKAQQDLLFKAAKNGQIKFDINSLEVKLSYADEEESARTTTGKRSSKKKNKAEEEKWTKGNYIRCRVSVNVKPALVFMQGVRSATIVMMIEYPASVGEDYPWFRDL